jgi:Xaa-Pro aminopeptidase
MQEHGLAGLLVTSEPNYRYLTGHRTQFWVSHSRPMFAVLPNGRPPIALVTEIEDAVIRGSSRLEDIRTWLGFVDDSLPVLADIFRELGFQGEKVGVDFGTEMRFGLPIPSFRRLESLARGVDFVDGSPVLWALRQIKSPREIAYIRKACAAAARGLSQGWRELRVGMTERQLQRRMAVVMLESGADKVLWLPIHAGPGNYAKFTMEPTGRRLRPGDMVWVDAGVTVNGYWSDFNRIAVVGKPTPQQRDTYKTIWQITRACIEAMRPGIPIGDLVTVRDDAYRRLGFVETVSRSGRMGHGSGLDITEPPSVALHDPTVLDHSGSSSWRRSSLSPRPATRSSPRRPRNACRRRERREASGRAR